jgi:hypothetical protein
MGIYVLLKLTDIIKTWDYIWIIPLVWFVVVILMIRKM